MINPVPNWISIGGNIHWPYEPSWYCRHLMFGWEQCVTLHTEVLWSWIWDHLQNTTMALISCWMNLNRSQWCLLNKPSMYIYKVCDELFKTTGRELHPSTICRTIHTLGFTTQKLRKTALQWSQEKCGGFLAENSLFRPSYVWLDETGCNHRNNIDMLWEVRLQLITNYV